MQGDPGEPVAFCPADGGGDDVTGHSLAAEFGVGEHGEEVPGGAWAKRRAGLVLDHPKATAPSDDPGGVLRDETDQLPASQAGRGPVSVGEIMGVQLHRGPSANGFPHSATMPDQSG
jgi:hypothetical protein